MSTARITACIPTYNRAHFLYQALHSLCDQGLARDEYVVAISDNCSEDRTPDVVEEYRDRLQIVYHKNSEPVGLKANFEAVTALCETPYLTFLPDDDLVAPGHLARALSASDAHKGAVLVSSLAVSQLYPGDPKARFKGMFLRATRQTSYSEPYVFDTTEWLALAVAGGVMQPSLVGSIFQYEALRRCELTKRFELSCDRILLAEMALHGDVLTLPWIGAYLRRGEHRAFHRMKEAYRRDSIKQTRELLDLCEQRKLPVLEFWIDQVCLSKSSQQEFYLSELKDKLPPHAYTLVQDGVEERLNTKPDKSQDGTEEGSRTKPAGRLDRWGVPKRLADPLRAVRNYLNK